MIPLSKGPTPQWILLHQDRKTSEYKMAPSRSKPTPWKVDEVIEALKRECHSKCMYCEGLVNDVAYLAVEHIRPKESHEDLVLEWENLGLACTRCNTNKGSYWTATEGLRLLNPYTDSVDEHLVFSGPMTRPAIGSTRGQNTIRQLKFNDREDLFVSRARRIEDLESRLDLWRAEADPETKELLAEDVQSTFSPDREFSAMLRSYASSRGFPIAS